MKQKKNLLFLVGILSILLVFGFVFVGCSDDDGGGNTNILPVSKGANALNGKTYFELYEKIVFSTTAEGAASGTYTKKSTIYNQQTEQNELDENGKYKYVDIETGFYSWDEAAKTVTISPEKIAFNNEDGYGPLQTKTEYRSSMQTRLNQEKEQMGEAAFNAEFQQMGFSSVSAYLDYVVNEDFANKTDGYSFSTDGTALFLSEALSANKGTNELKGKEFTSQYSSSNKVVFTSATAYSVKNGELVIETGEYRYDTSDVSTSGDSGEGKRVYLKVLTKNGKTIIPYYDSLDDSNAGYFESVAAQKAAQTNSNFSVNRSRYYLTGNTIRY